MPDDNDSSKLYNLLERVSKLDNYYIGLSANGAGDAVNEVSKLNNLVNSVFNPFFNKTVGSTEYEGFNLKRANTYCKIIPEKYGYSKVRTLILDNLDTKFPGVVNAALDSCSGMVEDTIDALSSIGRVYKDFVEHREKYTSPERQADPRYQYPVVYYVGTGDISDRDYKWVSDCPPALQQRFVSTEEFRMSMFLKYWGPGSNYAVYDKPEYNFDSISYGIYYT